MMNRAEREALAGRSIDAWNADDWIAGLREIWDPEGEIVSPQGWPEAGTFRGWEEMVGQWQRVKGSWAEERVEIASVDSYGEAVLAEVRWLLRGETSGAPLEVAAWCLYGFRDGKIARLEYFLDGEAAREAAAEHG